MDIKRFLEGFGKGTLLMLFVGGIMLYQTTSEFLVSLKPAISFADMLEEGTVLRPGDHVGGEVVYALDYFATESTYTRYSDGSRSGDRKAGRYYLIPTASGFVGLKSREQDVAALDTLSEETFTYLESGAEPSTQIYTEGIVQVMEGDEAGFFTDYLESMGYTKEEIDAMGEPLLIRYRSFMAIRIMFLIGASLCLLTIVLLCRRYKALCRDLEVARKIGTAG